MSEELCVGVDVGGTKTAIGLVTATGQVLERVVVPTPRDSAAELIKVINDGVLAFSRVHAVGALGLAIAGLVDASGSTVNYATHLALRSEPLKAKLEQATQMPVCIDNDATAAMWGEWKFGAAADVENSIMISVGTGVGGACVVGGEVQRGFNGMAGEIGHMRLVPDGRLCGCGLRGCWEQYASGRVLDRWANEQLHSEGAAANSLIDRAGSRDEVSGKTVSQLAREGNAEALAAVRELARNLGIGMASLAAILDPELFVIGGGLVELGQLLLEPVRESFDEHLFAADFRTKPSLVPALLGPDAALIGAAGQAFTLARA